MTAVKQSVSPAVKRFAKNLASAKTPVLITFHSLGDADAAASAEALREILAANGVKSVVRSVDSVNSQAKRVLRAFGFEAPRALVGIDAPSVALVDVSNADLLGDWGPALAGFKGGPLFVVDHHYHNKHVACAKGFALIEPKATSTAEIVLQIARALNVKPSKKTASILLCALLSDTAFFKSATNETFANACELIAAGADYAECAAVARSKRDASEALAVLKCVAGAEIEKLGSGANAAVAPVLVAFGKAHSHELACASALVEIGCDYAFVANEKEGRVSAAKSDEAKGNVGKIMEQAGRSFGSSGSGGGHEKVGGAKGDASRTRAVMEECLALVRKLNS